MPTILLTALLTAATPATPDERADVLLFAPRIHTVDPQRPAAEFVAWLFRFALGREPTPDELRTLSESMGTELSVVAIEDVLWVVVMLPEFQLVR